MCNKKFSAKEASGLVKLEAWWCHQGPRLFPSLCSVGLGLLVTAKQLLSFQACNWTWHCLAEGWSLPCVSFWSTRKAFLEASSCSPIPSLWPGRGHTLMPNPTIGQGVGLLPRMIPRSVERGRGKTLKRKNEVFSSKEGRTLLRC